MISRFLLKAKPFSTCCGGGGFRHFSNTVSFTAYQEGGQPLTIKAKEGDNLMETLLNSPAFKDTL